MKKIISKTSAEGEIKEFFQNITERIPKEVKKMKQLAMSYRIPLQENRKLFCKKCLTPFKNPKIRIKDKKKIVCCENCGDISRWKL